MTIIMPPIATTITIVTTTTTISVTAVITAVTIIRLSESFPVPQYDPLTFNNIPKSSKAAMNVA